MTEVTFNYVVLVSTEEIRGLVVNAWCIQNEQSLFSSIFKQMSDHEAVLYREVQVYSQLVSIPHSFSCVCACVRQCILCHPVYVYVTCLRTSCSVHCAFLIVARSAAPGVCSPPCTNSRMLDQMPNRKFDLVCSTLWLTLTRRPRKEALCFWLAVTSWDCTLKTGSADSLVIFAFMCPAQYSRLILYLWCL